MCFPGVIPGSYRLVGEFAGMQKFEGNLTVQTSTDASVDIALKVAQAATTVEVADVTPILQTDNATLSSTLERQRIEQMPVLGRGYQNLLQTVPGLIYSNHGHQVGGRALAYGLQVGFDADDHGRQPDDRRARRLGFAAAARSGCDPGDARRNQRLLGEVLAADDDRDVQPERDQRFSRRFVR